MKFGTLKSKIENKLLESYTNGSFKSELSKFKELVLSNKDISKMYHYYDELSSKKGLKESQVTDYINEVISELKSINLEKNDLGPIKKWLSLIHI